MKDSFSELGVPDSIHSAFLDSNLHGNFDVGTMQDVIRAILEGDSGLIPRERVALTTLLADFWDELQNIVFQDLFSDPKIQWILHDVENFSPEDLAEFFKEIHILKRIRNRYKRKLPVEFSRLQELSPWQLEFIKQRCIRSIPRIDRWSDFMKQAFLLQAIKYMWYGYDDCSPNHSGNLSQFWINITEFCKAFSIERSTLGNILAGDDTIGHPTIMQCIDAVCYYNEHWSLDWFERKKQSVAHNKIHSAEVDTDEISSLSVHARSYRANKLMQKMNISLSDITHENIREYYSRIIGYTAWDREKTIKVLAYFTDSQSYSLPRGAHIGFNVAGLAQKTGVSRQRYSQILREGDWNPNTIILRTLVYISDINKGSNTFSESLYEELAEELFSKKN